MWFSGDRPYRTEAWVSARTQLPGRGVRRSEAGNGLAAPRAGRGGRRLLGRPLASRGRAEAPLEGRSQPAVGAEIWAAAPDPSRLLHQL